MSDSNSLEIAIALERFLSSGSVREVYVAGGDTSPPHLAYIVNFPRLSIILDGRDEVELELDGSPRLVKTRKGEAIFVPSNCWNKPGWIRPAKVLSILFGCHQTGMSLVHVEHRGEPMTAVKTHFHRPLDGPAAAILDALSMLASAQKRKPTDRLLVEALLHSYLKLLRQPSRPPGGKADKTFHNISLYLQEHSQFRLTRDSVAEHFRLSPNHVSRLFRAEANTTFIEYLTQLRLERAKFLLRHHNRTVAEVAGSCGFDNAGYFCRVFKQKFRETPTDYRTQISEAPPL
jgi:AraC-like DNA-binding protein